MRISLKTRISLLIVLVVVLVSTAMGSLYIVDQLKNKKVFEDRLLADTQKDVETISYVVTPHLIDSNYVFMNNMVSNVKQHAYRAYVLITDDSGRILAHSNNREIGKAFKIPPHHSVKNAGKCLIQSYREDGREFIDISHPVMAGDLVLGTARIGLTTDWLKQENARKKQTLLHFTLSAAGVILLGIVSAFFVAGRIAHPILLLKQSAEKVGRGEYDLNINIERNDEVGMLAGSFNRMVHALKETTVSKDYVDNIIKSMINTLVVVSPGGKITRANSAACSLLAYEENELVGLSLTDIIAEEESGINDMLRDMIAEGMPIHNRDMFYRAKGGRLMPVLFSGSVMRSSNGTAQAIVFVAQDITRLKEIEERLKQSAGELEATNRELESQHRELEKTYTDLKAAQTQILHREKMASIGQLAAGVAHEINNPTGFVLSNLGTLGKYVDKMTEFINAQTEALESARPDGTQESLKELREKIKLDYILKDVSQLIRESFDGAERIKRIVQNLKGFSRLDEAEFKDADINECIESTLNIVWNELKYNATVIKEYGELPATKCYPQQLNQVFMNLLVNAAQAIEKQGEIKIRTWNGDGFINISISDTGEGIPENKLNKIFEPFYTTKPVGKGTGLGLSIAFDIVKKHNGDIQACSEVGKGTIFSIKIPIVSTMK